MPPRSTPTRPIAARAPRAARAAAQASQPLPQSEPEKPGSTGKRTLPVFAVMGVLLLIALGMAGYFYYQYQKTSQAADEKEIESLTEEIGALILLPEGETPTLATVTDREKLADQPFFARAENGDKVLIYSNSGRAILYRPSQKKIVDVTTVAVNTPVAADPAAPAQAPGPGASEPAIVRIALLNGSQTVGLTNRAEAQLKTVAPTAAVVTKENAKKDDYPATVVVAVNQAASSTAAAIAEALGGRVGPLPEGEEAPSDADVIVILAAPVAAADPDPALE